MTNREVVHIIDRLPADGAERLLVDVLRSKSGDFDYTVLCLVEGGPLVAEIEALGIPVLIFGRRGTYDFSLLFRVVRWLRAHRPVAVHTHLFTADSWGRLAALIAGVPAIFSTVHSTNSWKGAVHRFVDRGLTRLSTRVIACSDEVEQVLIEVAHLPPARVLTIANGVDLNRFVGLSEIDLARAFGLPAGRVNMIVVGRLHPAKGHSDLLPVLARVKEAGTEFNLLIVGEGELENDLRQQVASLQLESHVRFCGFRQDVLALIAAADVMLMPSRWEGLPMALLEAMALSRPVLATAVGGIPNVIRHDHNGLLVAPGDEKAMEQHLRSLINDTSLRRRLGSEARETVYKHFSAANVARRYEALYRESMGSKRKLGVAQPHESGKSS